MNLTAHRLMLLALCFSWTLGAAQTPLYETGNRIHSGPTGDYYLDTIQPILSSRCVACHGCYEAPCQLNLQSYEGIRRGFNPEPIYASIRLREVKPTRLIDAKSVSEWRTKGFLPVVSSAGDEPEDESEDPRYSVLYWLLNQSETKNFPSNLSRATGGFAVNALKPLQKTIDEEAKHQCIASAKQFNQTFRYHAKNPWQVMYVGDFLQANPNAGMPFGLPGLKGDQTDAQGIDNQARLMNWIKDGAKGPDRNIAQKLEIPTHPKVIAAWEDFFNGSSTQAQQTARYIYEHVYTATLYFEENPGEYFELVRSRTLSPQPVDQIVTPLPYSDPGVSIVHYRLKKITRAIAQKTQLVWHLNDARLSHLKDLFLAQNWGKNAIPAPSYQTPNPFINFDSIPAAIRYQFLRENSKIIVAAMTQGSVCVGSTATYAISDHFWAWFLRPEIDPSVQTPHLGFQNINELTTAELDWKPKNKFERLMVQRLSRLKDKDPKIIAKVVTDFISLTKMKLDPEAQSYAQNLLIQLQQYGMSGEELGAALFHLARTSKANHDYQKAFEKQLRLLLNAHQRNYLQITDLWKGDGDSSYPQGNPNAWLNITRHERSASVQFGEEGGLPQSIWVMSFSNFERLYYNLVANFKEWGSVTHRMATWRHMSYVRLEGEDLAISFLPLQYRKQVRAVFARGGMAAAMNKLFPLYSAEGMYKKEPRLRIWPWDLPARTSPYFCPTSHRDSRYPFGDAQGSISCLIQIMKNYLGPLSNKPSADGISAERLKFEARLEGLSGKSLAKDGVSYAQFLPNIAYVRVMGTDESAWIYSLIVDRGYLAHNIMLREKQNREPREDSLTYYRGFVGAYPNVFFDVPQGKWSDFLSDLSRVQSDAWGEWLEAKWGIARNSERFWPFFDWLHAFKLKANPGIDPVEQGIVDLSQYHFFEAPEGR